MIARLGEVLFWASVILALAFLYLVYQQPNPIGYIAATVLIGWALRYILAGRKW